MQITITKGERHVTSYEINGTTVSQGNAVIQNGTFRSNETTVIHNFTTSDPPGTCFNFQFLAISGTGNGIGKITHVATKDMCYEPSKPIVNLGLKSLHWMQMMITKGEGYATSYVMIFTEVSQGNTLMQSGLFLSNEKVVAHIVTFDPPGTCFNVQLVSLSAAGSGIGISAPVVMNDTCYEPSEPNVMFGPKSLQWMQVMITKGEGYATSYEIIGTTVSRGNTVIQTGSFHSNETTVIQNFTTADPPGTCFNFQFSVISGSGNGIGSSAPVVWNNACYDPSKPRVSFVSDGIQSIRVTIIIVEILADSYEIIGTPINEADDLIQSGTFPYNRKTHTHVFTSNNEPGTCFNFKVYVISGFGFGAGRSESVIAKSICYNPSTPNAVFVPESVRSIQVKITKGYGQATSYEITGTPVSGAKESIQNGPFLFDQTSVTLNFTTLDLTGTCFNFRVMTISGLGKGAGRSEAFIMNEICYVTGPISRPVVQPEIQRHESGKNELLFYCDIEPSSNSAVLYTVMWYKDRIDAGSLVTSSSQLPYSSKETFRSMTLLTERNITLGITLFCTVSATKLKITVPSQPYFVGMEITPDDAVSIQDSEKTLLNIRSTIPFGCLDLNDNCLLNVNMHYTETGVDNCLLPAAAAFSLCGVRISSRRWNETYTLKIGVRHGQNLQSISRTYNILFKTDEDFDHHELFRNYTLPKVIQVKVSTDTSNLNGKECHAISDPHMLTFDGRYNENQNNGTYILYKHSRKPIQVQMKTGLCYGIPQGPPFCPCGVAIAAGRDVFVIDRCSIPIKIYMPKCDDGTLKGKVKTDGNSYQIYLPTGSLLKINGGISFNIYLYPSVSDRETTSGLCGYLDNDKKNDFTLRNGSWVPENEFEAFNSNWEVKPEEDLFIPSNYKSLPIWPTEENLCVCTQYEGGHVGQSYQCSPDSRMFCHDNSLNDSLAATCNMLLDNSSGAVVHIDESFHNISGSDIITVKKNQTMKNYTADSASIECWSFLNRSKLFKKCSEIPDIDPSSFVNTCAKDAVITSTMNWASTHLDSAQKSCLYQVIVNQPLPKDLLTQFNVTVTKNNTEDLNNKTESVTSIYTDDFKQSVQELACPMDCSSHGNCSKGTCNCEDKFGDVDCSVDLREPPVVYGIPERGVCDLQKKSCENISVLGDHFVGSENLSCRLYLFYITLNGTILFDNNTIIVKGERISFAEVSCPLPDARSIPFIQDNDALDTVTIGYGVAVSNNRNNFSQDTSLLLLDSLCIDCKKNGFNIACKQKEGFHLINRTCIRNVTPSTPTEPGPDLVVIISSVIGTLLVLLGSLLLLCCVMQAKKRKKLEREKREKAYQGFHETEGNKEYYGIVETYDQIDDQPDTYDTISNTWISSKSTNGEERYMKFRFEKNDETGGYSFLSKDVSDNYVLPSGRPDIADHPSPAENTNIPYRTIILPRVKILTKANTYDSMTQF
ncbi:hypothetical protein ACJMK2_021987 [Sinanodonta woodiana]|uniref:VWFD domain-containing protein n=1 Tax=Sinanodonta woodiana TaxID=1069815 RepID=A0ABD3TJQ2_SINWO